jgi:endonuclease/exonuclease/phosphatase family metal-dependent hydrolase
MTQTLHIATCNIHKGFSQFSRRMALHDLKDTLHGMRPDVVFLQEVQGSHERRAAKHNDWPEQPQHEFIAGTVWSDHAYGRNAIYPHGHHGNAILSRFPIKRWENVDISTNPFESRGLLHAEVAVPGWKEALHCVCVHLNLFARGRRKQYAAIRERMLELVPPEAPLIVAGDFNDWRREACASLAQDLNLREIFTDAQGQPARSFPALLPFLSLDRMYYRGFKVKQAEVHHGRSWSRLSDHAALSATIARA